MSLKNDAHHDLAPWDLELLRLEQRIGLMLVELERSVHAALVLPFDVPELLGEWQALHPKGRLGGYQHPCEDDLAAVLAEVQQARRRDLRWWTRRLP